jgi:hypothetical protein
MKSLKLKKDQPLFESEGITTTLSLVDFLIIDIELKNDILKEASLTNTARDLYE